MPFQINGRGDMNAFVLTSPLAGVMLLTRRQPFYPSAAHDKFHSICTAFGGYTEFGIAPKIVQKPSLRCSTDCSAVSPSCTPRDLPHFNPSSHRQLYTVLVDKPICSQAALTSISSTSFSTSALYSALYFVPFPVLPFFP